MRRGGAPRAPTSNHRPVQPSRICPWVPYKNRLPSRKKPPAVKAEGSVEKEALTGKSGANLAGLAVDFLETGGLAAQSADIEKLRAPHFVAADLLDLVDDLGVEGKDALDALTEAHLAHGEGALGAVVDGDDQALE